MTHYVESVCADNVKDNLENISKMILINKRKKIDTAQILCQSIYYYVTFTWNLFGSFGIKIKLRFFYTGSYILLKIKLTRVQYMTGFYIISIHFKWRFLSILLSYDRICFYQTNWRYSSFSNFLFVNLWC